MRFDFKIWVEEREEGADLFGGKIYIAPLRH